MKKDDQPKVPPLAAKVYITLLREGARTHGLPEHYIRFLEQIQHAR